MTATQTTHVVGSKELVLDLPVKRFQLSCGATLLVSPRPTAPITAVQIHIRGGFSLDSPQTMGTAFMAGALAPEGTTQFSEEQLADRLEPYGGSISGDSSGLSGQIVGEQWKLLCDLMADCLLEPTYPKRKVERQRDRLLQRLLVEEDDARLVAARKFRHLIYGEHWLGRPERGTAQTVKGIERGHLAAFRRRNWVASRAVIAVCGNVSPAAVQRFFERRLENWKTGRDLGPPKLDFPRPAHRFDAFVASRQQVHLFLGHLGVRRNDPDYVPLMVMDHVLGTGPGFADRISRRLRDVEGLAYSVSANVHSSAGTHPGLFTAYIGTSAEKVPQALRGFIEEIERIREQPVAPEELELVHSYLTGSFVLGFERASRRAQYLVFAHRQGLPDDYLSNLPARIRSVSIEDVQRVARRHLRPDDLCLAGGGPIKKKQLQEALTAALAH